MAEFTDREHYIPIRLPDLLDLLCREQLADDDRGKLRSFSCLLAAIFHFEFHHSLDELKNAYAPFDPDNDVRPLTPWTADERQHKLNQLYQQFDALLERANYVRLTREKLEAAFEAVSAWGINMEVDFTQFDRLELYYRGDTVGQRIRKNWRTRWKEQVLDVDIYQRIVMIVKLRATPHTNKLGLNTDAVFIKIFKDIPKADLEMLLPGAKLRFSRVDRGKIGLPVFIGSALLAWQALKATILAALGFAAVATAGSQALLWGMTVGALGYGYRSYSSYNNTKNIYSLNLTRSLYYQNLDNNAGVLFRIIDSAEEQECREALLGYFFLWREPKADGWTAGELDDHVEAFLQQKAKVRVDFEIEDALAKLLRHGLVDATSAGRYRALPISDALAKLDHTWDNYFQFNA